MTRGWFGERYRHSLAAKGIKSVVDIGTSVRRAGFALLGSMRQSIDEILGAHIDQASDMIEEGDYLSYSQWVDLQKTISNYRQNLEENVKWLQDNGVIDDSDVWDLKDKLLGVRQYESVLHTDIEGPAVEESYATNIRRKKYLDKISDEFAKMWTILRDIEVTSVTKGKDWRTEFGYE